MPGRPRRSRTLLGGFGRPNPCRRSHVTLPSLARRLIQIGLTGAYPVTRATMFVPRVWVGGGVRRCS
jgi:hypothetical protein